MKAASGSPKTRRSVRVFRIALAVAGMALIGFGLWGLPTQLGPEQLFGLLVWMAVAVLVHDGMIVPLSTLGGAGLTRAGSRLRPASAGVLRGGLLTGALMTLLALLLVTAQSEARDTSVLEADYAANLLWFWAALAIVSGVAIYAIERAAAARGESRQKTRP